MSRRTRKPARTLAPRVTRLWLTIAAGLVLAVASVGAVVALSGRALVVDDSDMQALVDQTRSLQAEEYHQQVVALLAPHIPAYHNDPKARKLFGWSRTQVPLPGNAHVSQTIRVFQRVAELAPQDPEVARYLFELYRRTEQFDLAVTYGQRALQLDPQDNDLRAAVVRVMIENGDVRDALQLARTAIDQALDHVAAYETCIEAMVAAKTSAAEILSFAEHVTRELSVPVSKRHLLLIYAQAAEDEQELSHLLDQSLQDPTQHPQEIEAVVTLLENSGRPQRAMKLLEAAAADSSSNELQRALIYRYWQNAQFTRLLEQMRQLPDESHGELADEMLVLQTLSLKQLGRPDEARKTANQLRQRATQLARLWVDVLDNVLRPDASARELSAACTRALAIYPQSAYLLHYQATAYEMAAERDLAIATYRRAIQLAPRWVVPRESLAKLLLEQGDEQGAFDEASTVLRANPVLPGAFEVAFVARIQLAENGTPVEPAQDDTLRTTIARWMDIADDSQTRSLLAAAAAHLAGRRAEADQHVERCLQAAEPVDGRNLQLLLALASDQALREKLQQLAAVQRGLPYEQIVEQAVMTAGQEGDAAGISFLRQYRLDGQPLPEITLQIATADFLAARNHADARKHLLEEVAEQYRANPRILQWALSQPVLARDVAAQDQLCQWLKDCSPENGVMWRMAEARHMLAGELDQKTAAQVVLQLNDVLKQAPRLASAYTLMVQAFDRLSQPDKGIEALQTALVQGADRPGIRLELSQRLLQANKPTIAVPHARAVADSNVATPAMRRTAARLLTAAGAFDAAVNALRRDLPARIEDNDRDFALVSGLAFALARCGRAEEARPYVAPLAATTDRWFDLWLAMSSDEQTPVPVTVACLEQAGGWLHQDANDRRRKLAAAWCQHARRRDDERGWRAALKLLEPVMSTEATIDDWRQIASVYRHLGETEPAIVAYQRVAETATDARQRATALNNLAMLWSQQETHLAEAEVAILESLQLHDSPEFVDTLANVLVARDETAQAIELLMSRRNDFPDDVGLLLRLGETLLLAGETDHAGQILHEIHAWQQSGCEPTLSEWQRINELRRQYSRMTENVGSTS